MNYSGIDLHSNNCVVVVSDEADRVLCKRRVPNELSTVLALLEPHRAELAGVVVESTYNWYWLVDGLQAAEYRVHLANTSAIKQYEGLKHSGDDSDAAHLAHLLRLGILPTGYISPPPARALRDLSRKRLQLTRSRTAHTFWRWRTLLRVRPEDASVARPSSASPVRGCRSWASART